MWFLPSPNWRERLAFGLNANRTIECSTPGNVALGTDRMNDKVGLITGLARPRGFEPLLPP